MSDPKAKPAGKGEPSMEEILASIRRIISDDGDPNAAKPAAAAPATAAPAPAPAPAAAPPSSDVLELTEIVEDTPPPAAAPPKPAATPAPQPPTRTPMSADENLVSSGASAAAGGALANLMAAKRQADRPQVDNPMPIGNPGITLEQIVREEMRPMLKAWLDQNLPGMVERLVQREIQRITRSVD
jgi:cell pole-organizing protein PopZ